MGKSLKQKEALLKVNIAKRLTTEEFIEKARHLHGSKYDYSMTEYINAKSKIKIICFEHGVQKMLPHHHIKGYGCGKCGKKQINISNGSQLTQEQFIERVKHIDGLTFEKTVYTTKRNKITVTCVRHGDYETRAEVLLKGCGCPKCKSSTGESVIANILDDSSIVYFRQFGFPGCRHIRPLKFDFYIPSLNLCIEYDGKQHFKSIEYWGGDVGLKNRQKSDTIKEKFCLEKGINLLRIAYNEDIKDKLGLIIKI